MHVDIPEFSQGPHCQKNISTIKECTVVKKRNFPPQNIQNNFWVHLCYFVILIILGKSWTCFRAKSFFFFFFWPLYFIFACFRCWPPEYMRPPTPFCPRHTSSAQYNGFSIIFSVCGSQNCDLRVAAHDKLGEVLHAYWTHFAKSARPSTPKMN